MLGNLFLRSFGLGYGPSIPKVRILVRVNRIIPSCFSNLSAQSLKFLFTSHITPLLGLQEGSLAHQLHQMALLVVDSQVRITQGFLEFCNLLLGLLHGIFHIVDSLNVVSRHLGLLLPFNALLLMLTHLVAVEVQLLVHGLCARCGAA